MTGKHCKDIPEDMFKKADFHHQHEPEIEPLTGMESLDYQQLLEKQRLNKLKKLPDSDATA